MDWRKASYLSTVKKEIKIKTIRSNKFTLKKIKDFNNIRFSFLKHQVVQLGHIISDEVRVKGGFRS